MRLFAASSGYQLSLRSPLELSAGFRAAVPVLKARQSPPTAALRPLLGPKPRTAENQLPTPLLAAYGYVEKATQQSAEALTGIKMWISIFPGLLYISCAFILIFYTIDEATCDRMKRELEERRGEEAAVPG